MIDNVDASVVPLHWLRQRVQYVPQSGALLGDTLRSSLVPPGLSPGEVEADSNGDEALWKVLDLVGISRTVKSMPNGLTTHITDCGRSTFSRGEMQLLILARATLADSPILIFDECTASLDAEADRVAQEVILGSDKTVLSICHRLESIRKFDLVMVLDEGRCVEFGNPLSF